MRAGRHLQPQDLAKLLAYSDDKPVVFGTRTSPQFIWAGANMGWFLRWGNWAVAKMTEALFSTSILTDMGCTYRLLRREALELIRPHLDIGGSHFGPQILLEVIPHRIPFVEIPLNYRESVGSSSVTGDLEDLETRLEDDLLGPRVPLWNARSPPHALERRAAVARPGPAGREIGRGRPSSSCKSRPRCGASLKALPAHRWPLARARADQSAASAC